MHGTQVCDNIKNCPGEVPPDIASQQKTGLQQVEGNAQYLLSVGEMTQI